jgi:hypothetical protein
MALAGMVALAGRVVAVMTIGWYGKDGLLIRIKRELLT